MKEKILARISEVNNGYGKFMSNAFNPRSLRNLCSSLAIISSFWVFAWYGHIIAPWIDHYFDLGSHDIDSANKILWRRIWTSVICIPSAIGVIVIYIRNRRQD